MLHPVDLAGKVKDAGVALMAPSLKSIADFTFHSMDNYMMSITQMQNELIMERDAIRGESSFVGKPASPMSRLNESIARKGRAEDIPLAARLRA
jgi:hypothetical protein